MLAGIMDWGLLLYVERCQVLWKGNIGYLTCKHTWSEIESLTSRETIILLLI